MSVPSQEIALLAARPSSRPLWRECLVLTKPRVVALMLFTVLVGMLVAANAAALDLVAGRTAGNRPGGRRSGRD